jgi:hypothetical protein
MTNNATLIVLYVYFLGENERTFSSCIKVTIFAYKNVFRCALFSTYVKSQVVYKAMIFK